MKLLPTALLALSVASIAQAAEPKAAAWYTYIPGSQVCERGETPSSMMAILRSTYQSEAKAEDVTDDNGKVMAVKITVWNMTSQAKMMVNMFRAKASCEHYASERRTDTKKYD